MKKLTQRTLWLIAVIAIIGVIAVSCDDGSNTHTHSWGNWAVTTPATCMAEGLQTRACSGCTATETEVIDIDPDAHDMQVVEGEEEVAPTCLEGGFGKEACANAGCTHTENGVPIDPRGHDLHPKAGGLVIAVSTCTTAGEGELECVRAGCGHTANGSFPLDPDNHDWSDWHTVTPATCTADGEREKHCRYGTCITPFPYDDTPEGTKVIPMNPDAHHFVYDGQSVAPNCVDRGSGTATCSRCPAQKTEGDYEPDRNNHKGTPEPRIRLAATCIAEGEGYLFCTYCEEEVADSAQAVQALGHNYAPTAIWTTLSINCGNSGCTIPFTLAQHIQDAPQAGTAAAPVPLKVSINLETMGTDDNGWTQLLAALDAGGKLVNLDLSDSTMTTAANSFITGNAGSRPAAVDGILRIASIVLPDTVTSIGGGAFQNCTDLTSVTIGNSVTSIGNGVFMYCTGLTSIIIPNSVQTIGNFAFFDCTSMTSVTIGNSVTSIGWNAFTGTGLTSIIIPNSVISIGTQAFRSTGLTSVTFQRADTTIDDMTFPEGASLRTAYEAGGIGTYTRPDSASDVWAKQ